MKLPFFLKRYIYEMSQDSEVQFDNNASSYKECYNTIVKNNLNMYIQGFINDMSFDIKLMSINPLLEMEYQLINKYKKQIKVLNTLKAIINY